MLEAPEENPGGQAAQTLDQPSKVRRSGRKRISKSPNSEDEDKKGKRGRPRVDPQDQSAVEVGKSNHTQSAMLILSSGGGPKSDSRRGHTENAKRPQYPIWSNGWQNFSKPSAT